MVDNGLILVTGAAGQTGSVGRTVVGLILDRGLPVRAMVRRDDERAASLRAAGAQVVVGDLLEPGDVYRVVSGCSRVYFSMSPSAGYLEATVTMVAVADVAQVVAAVLADPIPHLGRIYELTGPQSQDMDGVAREFSEALNREITYSDISPEKWEQGLKMYKLPEHLMGTFWRWASCTGRAVMTGRRT